jgi:hypothetical protein
MKLRSLRAWPLTIGALAAVATITMAPAVAAPPKPTVGPQTTIYSDTFTPLRLRPSYDSLQHKRYYSAPGASPNRFEGPGYEAFFNSPDLTLGPVQMSAVSAKVCLTFNGSDPEFAVLQFGVQDKDRNLFVWDDPDNPGSYYRLISPSESQQCETLTFAKPVKLVNHPHLVTALIMILEGSRVDVDGVTYTLQPSQGGDVTPTSEASSISAFPSWFGAD